MSVERVSHYKKTLRLRFYDEQIEADYIKSQLKRGRSTSIYSLLSLMILNLTYAFLEFWVLGIQSSIPMFGYLINASLTLLIILWGVFSSNTFFLVLRALVPGVLTLFILVGSVYLEKYRIYHALEFTLLMIWMGSLNSLSFRKAILLALSATAIFGLTLLLLGASPLKIQGLLVLMVGALSIVLYLSYIQERHRRTLYLTSLALEDLSSRQERWAYTLIDIDMALSGITDFKVLMGRLMEFVAVVINFDSFIQTEINEDMTLQIPDGSDGSLFDDQEQVYWSEELLAKLAQTRQATSSSQFDMEKGFLGKEKKSFRHFRLDIPVFNNSTLTGVISLRRESESFDDFDATSGVSIVSQALMIFNRSVASTVSMSKNLSKNSSKQQTASSDVEEPSVSSKESVETNQQEKEVDVDHTYPPTPNTSPAVDFDVTMINFPKQLSQPQSRAGSVVPTDVVQKMKEQEASVRKTITLLSRENADKIAADRYRTAAVEGEPLSVLLIEVDGLSSYREKDGDETAYKVFAGVVKYVFTKINRDQDVLGRYGQNGFSVLLPRIDMNAAERFAEEIREYAENTKFKTPYGERGATLSIGVAAITDETGNHDAMYKRADMALFVAKKNGRNCVKVRL